MGWKNRFGQLAIAKKHERTKEEKALVRRLDLFLMTFGFISQVIKYLDQTNINNAYISGMQDDLNLRGNELNFFTTYFNIGYVIMLIPSQIIMTYVRPSLWLPGLEVAWGVLTGLLATVQNANQVYALRFFVGLLEAGVWPGMMTLFMYWYTPSELAKRMGLYHSARETGAMMSGALQVAILNTLDGSKGIAGWRWLFVINSIMTVVVGAAGFFMLPDSPEKPNPWAIWFSKDHARLSAERLQRYGRVHPGKITWKSVKRVLSMWIVWFVPLIFWSFGLAGGATPYFGLFLKSLKGKNGKPIWSTTQANAIPIGGSAVTVVTMWLWVIASDVFQTRWQLLVLEAVIGIIPTTIMTIWTRDPTNVPINAAYASYFLAFAVGASAPLLLAWATDILPGDPDARSFIVGICVTGIYAINTGSQVGMWPASQAPYYYYGWPAALAFFVFSAILVIALRILDNRYLRPARLAAIPAHSEASDTQSANDASEHPADEKRV